MAAGLLGACLSGGRAVTALVLLAFAWPTLYAQDKLPELGDGQGLSYGQERQLGDRIARSLYQDPDYLDDPILADYVAQIWSRLLRAAVRRGELPAEMQAQYAWEVTLGRDARVNAFALPGGYLGVHLGLIGVVESEDELAAVLGHELSHVTQRHIARMMGREQAQAPWVAGAMILAMLAASRNPEAAGAVLAGGQAAAVQGTLNFSRDMEREADRVGYGILVEAGFNPRGAQAMFEKLQQAARHNDNSAFPYLRSHPLTSERIADMAARQWGRSGAAPLRGTMEHVLMAARARVMIGRSEEDWRRHLDAATSARMTGQHATQERAARLYAGVLAAMKLKRHDQANSLMQTMRGLSIQEPAATRQLDLLAAELALERGAPAAAMERLLRIERTEHASRASMLLHTRALTESGQASEAATMLQTWLLEHERDAGAWSQLSQAYAAMGRGAAAVRAQAEAHAAQFDLSGAHDRFKAAQQLAREAGPAVDHVEASIIDTRTRQIESKLREQALER